MESPYNELEPININQLVKWFQLRYPTLVKSMREANHHGENLNPHHLESDIFAHTMMVVKIAEERGYNNDVVIAALLHDIGKPMVRGVNPKNGHIRFFNHEPMGAFMSLNILEDLGLSDSKKQHIFQLIALHTENYKLTEDKLQKLLTNQQELANDLMRLSDCDHSGRFYDDGGVGKDKTTKQLKVDSKASEEKSKEVVIMCGLPASGKSTYVKEHYSDYFGISRDDLMQSQNPDMSYNEAWKAADQKQVDKDLQKAFTLAKNHDKVVVDMTHMSKKAKRKSLAQFGKDYKKTCIVCLPTLTEIMDRNENREGKFIGSEVYDKMIRSFYIPTFDMFDEIKYIWE